MKKALLFLVSLVTLVACETEPSNSGNQPTPPPPAPETQAIEIMVDDSKLTAYQVVYSIYPDDKEAYYYCDVMSKARWESADLKTIKAEFDESLRNFANMTGATQS